ncbi:MAG: SDR family oxidoreductase [Planctomycetota bacterium]|nr:SDR family oxidoreductase [Planctomycetota bacterium]MDA1178102.1 SDR family oxidoreductase [Planctomycetota bacterium]
MIPIELTGKTAIITGASQGLGLATAQLLHRAGANVVLNYFDDSDGQNSRNTMEAVSKLSERAVAVSADVRQIDEVAQMVDSTIRQFGTFDILVNNAGILRDKTVKNMSAEEWQSVIDTNLTGVFNTSHIAADKLSDSGTIVNLASISAVLGFFGQANYAAAKAGVIGLTKVVSRELAKRQIRVNAIAPGVILTDMGKSIPPQSRDQMLQQIPLNRFGEPAEIASVVLFLCSPLASYMTGQVLHVNGGWWG